IDVTGPAQRTEKIVRAAEPAAAFVTASSADLLDELVRSGCLPGDAAIVTADEAPVEGANFRTSVAASDWRSAAAPRVQRPPPAGHPPPPLLPLRAPPPPH